MRSKFPPVAGLILGTGAALVAAVALKPGTRPSPATRAAAVAPHTPADLAEPGWWLRQAAAEDPSDDRVAVEVACAAARIAAQRRDQEAVDGALAEGEHHAAKLSGTAARIAADELKSTRTSAAFLMRSPARPHPAARARPSSMPANPYADAARLFREGKLDEYNQRRAPFLAAASAETAARPAATKTPSLKTTALLMFDLCTGNLAAAEKELATAGLDPKGKVLLLLRAAEYIGDDPAALRNLAAMAIRVDPQDGPQLLMITEGVHVEKHKLEALAEWIPTLADRPVRIGAYLLAASAVAQNEP